ncbi:nucleoside triphosphate pyrophosphohydrolase [Gracilibacillus sp. S3-1-1]|uniref:Nucleoside triphosphate pyrophosphohydrolase n=1 Tax=Gracilibacillus pellucidus TaxID=3095368 RepID=A0ACC6M0C0_9BACI|nr:nucleoside triphosphate pyrophosphohydrolase [Gracilibacillus sp. S3-1-1]MDX8044375.1 nucleoside triphosphate pyrophosphohydrolase [Gracilibacillus sp. S3-1-1]
MPTYNKLVRDKIPDILNNKGLAYNLKRLNEDKQYAFALKEKFQEEWDEYVNANNDKEALAELADLLEVIYALSALHNSTNEELDDIRKQKYNDRGGFEQKYILVDVEDK